jgi:hypothetical protein
MPFILYTLMTKERKEKVSHGYIKILRWERNFILHLVIFYFFILNLIVWMTLIYGILRYVSC